MKRTQTKRLIEAALMVALATVLSMIKIIELPYGGSVTLASMLPILILSYRHGILFGLGGGLVYAAVQQLLGLNNLSYAPNWQSVIAIIMLDYIIAFAVVGLGGIFRRFVKNQPLALLIGAIGVSVLRFLCHFIVGFTVWRDISIPASAAVAYSLGYNAAYMIPETIILAAVAYYLGSVLDFSREQPTRVANLRGEGGFGALYALSGLLVLGAVIADSTLLFPHLQSESGEFDFGGIGDANWIAIGIITGVALLAISAILVYAHIHKKEDAE